MNLPKSLILLLALALAACGGAPQPAVTNAPVEAAATAVPPQPTMPAPPSQEVHNDAEAGQAEEAEFPEPAAGLDIATLDPCALLPMDQIAAVIGKFDPPTPTIAIDREKGCQYTNPQNGHFYEISLYPLDQWELAEVTLRQAQPVEGIGAGAFLGTYSDSMILKVLAKDKVMIEVRVSDSDLEKAKALAQIALQNLP